MPGEPIGLHCPECGTLARFTIGVQAFCGNGACELLCWEPSMTLEEHEALPRHEIDLSREGAP